MVVAPVQPGEMHKPERKAAVVHSVSAAKSTCVSLSCGRYLGQGQQGRVFAVAEETHAHCFIKQISEKKGDKRHRKECFRRELCTMEEVLGIEGVVQLGARTRLNSTFWRSHCVHTICATIVAT